MDSVDLERLTIAELFKRFINAAKEIREEGTNGQVWWRGLKDLLPAKLLEGYQWKILQGVPSADEYREGPPESAQESFLGKLAILEGSGGSENLEATTAHFALQVVRIPNGSLQVASAHSTELCYVPAVALSFRKLMQVALNLGQLKGSHGHGLDVGAFLENPDGTERTIDDFVEGIGRRFVSDFIPDVEIRHILDRLVSE